jgi:transposase
MTTFVGLDVSLKETSICIVDEAGSVMKEGTVLSDPDKIADYVRAYAPSVSRIGLESGPTSSWRHVAFRLSALTPAMPVPPCRCS